MYIQTSVYIYIYNLYMYINYFQIMFTRCVLNCSAMYARAMWMDESILVPLEVIISEKSDQQWTRLVVWQDNDQQNAPTTHSWTSALDLVWPPLPHLGHRKAFNASSVRESENHEDVTSAMHQMLKRCTGGAGGCAIQMFMQMHMQWIGIWICIFFMPACIFAWEYFWKRVCT